MIYIFATVELLLFFSVASQSSVPQNDQFVARFQNKMTSLTFVASIVCIDTTTADDQNKIDTSKIGMIMRLMMRFSVFLVVYLSWHHFNSITIFVSAVQQRQQPPQNRRRFFPRVRGEGSASTTNKGGVAVEAAAAVDATFPSLKQRVLAADGSSIDEKTSIVDGIEKRNESSTDQELQSNVDNDENEQQHLRPAYVRDLLLQHEKYLAQMNQTEGTTSDPQSPPIIYYFGLGSNMLRSKLENRGNGFGGSNMTTTNATTSNSTESTSVTNKIEIISMEAAYIKNYRLSFNLRGFCPLEPGMGSLEPIDDDDSSSKPLHTYEEPECHGALIALTLDNYERVMRSEGVGPNVTNPGYEEIVITAIPYNTSRVPVTAVALRARPHVRLRQDPSPSQRYMDILRQGAAELQLRSSYQTYLQTHPVQETPPWLQKLAVYNLICTMTISSKLKWRGLSKLQSFLLYKVYIPCGLPRIMKWQRTISNLCMGGILFPGACFGRMLQLYCTLFKKTHSPMMQRFISMMDINNKTQASDDDTAKRSPADASK